MIPVRVLAAALAFGIALAVASETPEELAKRAIASVKRDPAWQEITINNADPNGGRFTLVYKQRPAQPPLAIVERDTTTIGRAILKALVAADRKPKDIHVWVSAQMPAGQGETGQSLVRPYGHSSYDSSRDGFVFERFKMP